MTFDKSLFSIKCFSFICWKLLSSFTIEFNIFNSLLAISKFSFSFILLFSLDTFEIKVLINSG